jgi:hypothetical protein
MGENYTYEAHVKNNFLVTGKPSRTSVVYQYLGDSEPLVVIPPDPPNNEKTFEIKEGRMLNLWLAPEPNNIPKKIDFKIKHESYQTPYNGGKYACQVIRSFGLPPGAEPDAKPTPIWTIVWGSLSPVAPQEGGPIKQNVNVTVSEPPQP